MDHSHLHACKRCRGRKIKCDKKAPKCSACEKGGSDCVFIEPVTLAEYTRETIAELEAREAGLQKSLQNVLSQHSYLTSADAEESPNTAKNDYVGEGSGVKFLETVLQNPRWSGLRARLVGDLSDKAQIKEPATVPAPFPSHSLAARCIETYLNESHIQKPFLLARDVYTLYGRLYPGGDREVIRHESQDLFRLFMICAIAAVNLQRRGFGIDHPYSFFLAAQPHLQNMRMLDHGIDAIQNLLLLTRFGVYYHIGTSIWEICRICMRLCVNLEMHLNPLMPLPPLEEQHRRRMFWECYALDRYSSSTLGRPFAIADEDIEVKLPAALSDEDVVVREPGHLDDTASSATLSTVGDRNTMSVFILYTRLRQITSRIHDAFFSGASRAYSKGNTPPSGHDLTTVGVICTKLQTLLDELEEWRRQAPVYSQAYSLYQREQWYDFLLEKERLTLVRGAMNRFPLQAGRQKRLLQLCGQYASRIIQLYSEMFSRSEINTTRGYFQMLFSAGLSLAYCLSSGCMGTGLALLNAGDASKVLRTCSELLWKMGETMQDARPYAVTFDFIQQSLSNETQPQAHESTQSTGIVPAPTLTQTSEAAYPPPMDPLLMSGTTSSFPNVLQHGSSGVHPDLQDVPQSWYTWDPSMQMLMANMEADVNRFAFDTFSMDPAFEFEQLESMDNMFPYDWQWSSGPT